MISFLFLSPSFLSILKKNIATPVLDLHMSYKTHYVWISHTYFNCSEKKKTYFTLEEYTMEAIRVQKIFPVHYGRHYCETEKENWNLFFLKPICPYNFGCIINISIYNRKSYQKKRKKGISPKYIERVRLSDALNEKSENFIILCFFVYIFAVRLNSVFCVLSCDDSWIQTVVYHVYYYFSFAQHSGNRVHEITDKTTDFLSVRIRYFRYFLATDRC